MIVELVLEQLANLYPCIGRGWVGGRLYHDRRFRRSVFHSLSTGSGLTHGSVGLKRLCCGRRTRAKKVKPELRKNMKRLPSGILDPNDVASAAYIPARRNGPPPAAREERSSGIPKTLRPGFRYVCLFGQFCSWLRSFSLQRTLETDRGYTISFYLVQ